MIDVIFAREQPPKEMRDFIAYAERQMAMGLPVIVPDGIQMTIIPPNQTEGADGAKSSCATPRAAYRERHPILWATNKVLRVTCILLLIYLGLAIYAALTNQIPRDFLKIDILGFVLNIFNLIILSGVER